MVIQCPECTTRFKLSAEKIKPEGVKVRCAKCSHIFTVLPEPVTETTSGPEESTTEDLAAGPYAAAPELTQPPDEPGIQPPAIDDLWGPDFGESSPATVTGAHEPAEGKGSPASDDDWGLGFDEHPDLPAGQEITPTPADTAAPPAGEDDWSDLLEPESAFDQHPTTETEPPHSPADLEAWGPGIEEEAFASAATEEGPTTATESQATEADDEWSDLLDESALGLSSLDDMPTETFAPATEFQIEDQWDEEPEAEPAVPLEMAAGQTHSDPDEILEEEISGDAFDLEFEEESTTEKSLAEPDDIDLAMDEFSFEEDVPAEAAEDLAGFSFDESAPDEFSFESESTDTQEPFSFDESNLFAVDNAPSSEPEDREGIGFDLPVPEAATNDNLGFEGISFGEGATDGKTKIETQETIAPAERAKPVKKTAPAPDPLAESNAHRLPLPKQKRKTPMSGVLRIFLVLLLVLGGAAGYLLWRGGTTDILQIMQQIRGIREPAAPVGQIRLPLPNSFFIMNQEVGQIFVVQGEAVNGYPENRSAIAVKGMLHDEMGNVLMQQTVFCGNLLSYEDLQTESFSRIEEAMNNQFGNALSNLNVGPGKAIPYMIVFRALPTNVAEFTVEVVDSKPGGQP
jgi:predicted Zn finger-like uncharacterized protein